MSIPGNAYVAQTGGTFTAPASPAVVALAAATAKTVLAITTGTANQPSIVEIGFFTDGTVTTNAPVLVEIGYLTAATAGTSTAGTAQQIRGWPAQTSQQTAAYNYTVEPTAYSVIARQWLVPFASGALIVQFPLGRELTGIVTAATAGKAIGIRATSPAIVNCRAYIEYEE